MSSAAVPEVPERVCPFSTFYAGKSIQVWILAYFRQDYNILSSQAYILHTREQDHTLVQSKVKEWVVLQYKF